MNSEIRKIVVIGASVSGLISAYYLSHQLKTSGVQIKIISDGAKEQQHVISTHPSAHVLFQTLGIDIRQLMKATDATFNLGHEYIGWHPDQDKVFVPFTPPPQVAAFFDFHQFWLQAREQDPSIRSEDFSLAIQAARSGKFALPSQQNTHPLTKLSFGLNFNAQKLNDWLLSMVLKAGVQLFNNNIKTTVQKDNIIASVTLDDGTSVDGDFFIDCSGSTGSVSDVVMGPAMTDESTNFPANQMYRAVVGNGDQKSAPFVTLKALPNGWLKHSFLQGSNELVFAYNKDQINADTVRNGMQVNVEQDIESDGFSDISSTRRSKTWINNCLALGNASLPNPPMEASNLTILIKDIMRFVKLFPSHKKSLNAEEFNRLTNKSHNLIQDYQNMPLSLAKTERSDFWQDANQMNLSEDILHQMNLFKTHGRLAAHLDDDLIPNYQWVAMLIGLGVMPNSYHPLLDEVAQSQALNQIKNQVQQLLSTMPDHDQFLQKFMTG